MSDNRQRQQVDPAVVNANPTPYIPMADPAAPPVVVPVAPPVYTAVVEVTTTLDAAPLAVISPINTEVHPADLAIPPAEPVVPTASPVVTLAELPLAEPVLPLASPVIPLANPTAIATPPAIAAVPPPAITAAPSLNSDEYLTTEWLETWLDSTSRTWYPTEITRRSGDYVTTQWVGTWLDSTSKTWVPITITMRYDGPGTSYGPPGKGAVGMGTLTGEAGKTQTVVMGAAASQVPAWKRGVVAAMGVGMVGMVV